MTTHLHIPLKERLKTIPEVFGIRVNEEPHYEVLKKDGDFEVRKYPKLLVAKFSMRGTSFDYFKQTAFEKLANYIFEGNDEGRSIPMTSPVMEEHGVSTDQEPVAMHSHFVEEPNEGGGWTMSFILPREITKENAPTPKDDQIKLEEKDSELIASFSYSGNNNVANIKAHERMLAEWLNSQPNIQVSGKYMIAQYDAPFVIPFMKKNEIHVKVENIH